MSSAGDRLRLRRQMRQRFEDRDPALQRFRATIGDGAGNVEIPGKHSTVYIRREGRSRVEEALNVHVPQWNDLPVICGYEQENPDKLQILRVDWGALPEGGNLSYLPNHHENHELLNPNGGMDVVWVDKGQVIPLAPFPTNPPSMQIWIQKDFYPWQNSVNCWPGGLTADLSAYFPTAHNGIYVTVSVDGATNALQYTAGTEFPIFPPPPEGTAIPAAPAGSVPSVSIYLWAGANLLTNDPGLVTDSFETAGGGGPDIWAAWTEFVGAGALANDAVIFYAAGGGLNSCQTTEGGGGRDTGVYEDFAVTAGNCYQLRFWTRDDGGANDGAYHIYDVTNGADIVAITGTGVVGGPAWTEITVEFTAPAGCTTVRVYFYCPAAGGNQAWFDDATVAQVPCSLSRDSFRDARLFNQPMPGSVAPMPHDILSASHSDTTPAAVVRGDLMTGQGVAPAWARLAHPGAALSLLESTATESQWAATDDGDVANTVVRTDANAAIRPNRLGVGTPAPNQNGVIAQTETADPAGGGGGTTRLYPKNDGGQSKYYFMDDTGSIYEIAGIAEDVTVTVGAAGDFVAIQDAIDWFKNWIIKGACVISEIDEGTYDEAVDFSSILIAPGATLTLQGDTRALAGITYVVGAVCNRAALANGGTFNDANPCTISVNAAGDEITISGGTVDPDFSAGGDNWVAGDRILVFGNDDTIYERIINSISPGGAGNNVIEITVALPGAAFPGGGGALDDGSAVALVPNRAIERTVAGACITVNGVRGVVVDGWYLETSTGAGCRGISNIYAANCWGNNLLVQAEDEALYSSAMFASLDVSSGAVSVWGADSGVYANNVAQCLAPYGVAVDCERGFRCQAFSFLQCTYGIATHCGTAGFHLSLFAHIYCAGGCARQNAIGYYCEKGSYMEANVTDRYNNGNAVDYDPDDANPLPKYVQGNGYATIYMSN